MPSNDAVITSRDMCNQAVVERILSDASVSSIKIAANLASDNYDGGVISSDPGTVGWRIERNTGNAVFNTGFFRDDILSTDWNGAYPANLASEDGAATAGFYLDSSEGAAQFSGNVWLGGNLTVVSGGTFRSATTGRRAEIDSANVGRIVFFTGDGSETDPPLVESHDGTTFWALRMGGPDFGDGATTLDIREDGLTELASDDADKQFYVNMPLHVTDGSVSAPAIRKRSAADGIYFSAGVLHVGLSGAEKGRFAAEGIQTIDGSASSVSFGFINDTSRNTGLFLQAEDSLGVAAGGVEMLRVTESTSDQVMLGPTGTASAPALSWIGDQNTGVYRGNADELNLAAGGVEILRLVEGTADYAEFQEQVRVQDGTVGAPSIRKAGAADGIYFGSGHLSVGLGGTTYARFSTDGIAAGLDTGDPLVRVNGDYSWTGDTDTLITRSAANVIQLHTGGTTAMQWGTAVTSVLIRDATTGSAANGFVNATSGVLGRSTSALKYKKNVSTNVGHLADIDLSPTKHWRDDDKAWRYGLVADWLADQDPLLGEYGDDGVENYDTRAVLAVLAAKVNRLEAANGS